MINDDRTNWNVYPPSRLRLICLDSVRAKIASPRKNSVNFAIETIRIAIVAIALLGWSGSSFWLIGVVGREATTLRVMHIVHTRDRLFMHARRIARRMQRVHVKVQRSCQPSGWDITRRAFPRMQFIRCHKRGRLVYGSANVRSTRYAPMGKRSRVNCLGWIVCAYVRRKVSSASYRQKCRARVVKCRCSRTIRAYVSARLHSTRCNYFRNRCNAIRAAREKPGCMRMSPYVSVVNPP